MRCQQNPKIDKACSWIGLGEEHVAVQDVVGDVRDEEDARHDEGAEHAVAMFDDLAAANVAITNDQKNGTERVEDGVKRWKECQVRACDVDGRMVVDKPREKERGDGADADD